MNLNTNSIVSKVKKHAGTAGFALGFMADPMGRGRDFQAAIEFISDRLSHWKPSTLAKPQFLLDFYKGNPEYIGTAKAAAMLYIAGELADVIGQGKYKKLLQDLGSGMFKGSIVALLAFAPAANPGGATASNFSNAMGVYNY